LANQVEREENMSTEIINSGRIFQLWSYTVSHSELLFRSTKSPEFTTRIDVFFKGVSEFHLPTTSHGLSIAEASDSVIRKVCSLRKSLPLDHGRKLFMVRGTDFVGYVAALLVACHEDEGEYHEPSFFAPKY
jgi:hypothetical protein